MPKMKTKRGAAKRFKATGTGKIVRHSAYRSHLLTCKTTKQKRRLRKSSIVDLSNVKALKVCLPYL
ncbi:MAG: 50S ribosomal protein L35 [Bradymonadales bacterium]|jgi:large subunit ribosomal protein L35